MSFLGDVMEQRQAAHDKIIKALAHLPRDHAINTILSWFSVKDLEEVSPTLCGSDKPVEDPVEAFVHRLNIACIQRGIEPMFIHARDGRRGKKNRSSAEIDLLLKAALKEAIS